MAILVQITTWKEKMAKKDPEGERGYFGADHHLERKNG